MIPFGQRRHTGQTFLVVVFFTFMFYFESSPACVDEYLMILSKNLRHGPPDKRFLVTFSVPKGLPDGTSAKQHLLHPDFTTVCAPNPNCISGDVKRPLVDLGFTRHRPV